MLDVKTVSISIDRASDEVYAFASDGANLPRWAHGVGKDVRREGDAWIADGPLGTAAIRFAPSNPFGVLDHDVTLPTGIVVHNPLRVMPNGAGCTVSFTLFRQPAQTEQQFADDAATVEADLQRLKRVISGS